MTLHKVQIYKYMSVLAYQNLKPQNPTINVLPIPNKPLWAPAESHGHSGPETECNMQGARDLIEFRPKVVQFVDQTEKIKKLAEAYAKQHKDQINKQSKRNGWNKLLRIPSLKLNDLQTLISQCQSYLREFSPAFLRSLQTCKKSSLTKDFINKINKLTEWKNNYINKIESTQRLLDDSSKEISLGAKQATRKAADKFKNILLRRKIMNEHKAPLEAEWKKKFGNNLNQIYSWLIFFYNGSNKTRLLSNLIMTRGSNKPKVTCQLFLEKFKNYNCLKIVMEALMDKFKQPMTKSQQGQLNGMKIKKNKLIKREKLFIKYGKNKIDFTVATQIKTQIQNLTKK